MNKTLTISVAAYNMGEYLKDALDSLLDATILPDIEVIVVDDGSTDDTADIAHQYESTFPETFRVISQQNGGYGSTINASLQQAHGKYFKQLDGDDFFITDNLQAYIGVLKHSTADIVYTVGEYRYENTAPPPQAYDCHIPARETPYDAAACSQAINLQLHCATFRTALLQEGHCQLPLHCMYTDVLLSLFGFYHAKTLLSTDLHVYCSRIGREGQTVSFSGYQNHVDDHVQVTRLVAKTYFGENASVIPGKMPVAERALSDMLCRSIHILLSFAPSGKVKSQIDSLIGDIHRYCPKVLKYLSFKNDPIVWIYSRSGGRAYELLSLVLRLKHHVTT